MSVTTEINKLKTNLVNAYNAISDKGGTIPLLANADNLASAIQTITGGGEAPDYLTPTITNYDAVNGVITGTNFLDSIDDTTYDVHVHTKVYFLDRYLPDQWVEVSGTVDAQEGTITLPMPLLDMFMFEGYTTIKLVNEIQDIEFYGTFESTQYLVYGEPLEDVYGILYYKRYVQDVSETRVNIDSIILENDADIANITGEAAYNYKAFPKYKIVGMNTIDHIPITLDQVVGFQYGDLATADAFTNFAYCVSFNQPIIYDNRFKNKTFSNILKYCTSFNSVIKLPTELTAIGTDFLNQCNVFNQPLDLSSITTIGNYFMNTCTFFNQPLDLSNVLTTGTYFLYNCTKFNKELKLNSNATSIDTSYFMCNCKAFNQELDLSGIHSLQGNSFMSGCESFNKDLYFTNLQNNRYKIGDYFLKGCKAFNSHIIIRNDIYALGSEFMYECESFNKDLSFIKNVSYINSKFMYGCKSFNQPIKMNLNCVPNDPQLRQQYQDIQTLFMFPSYFMCGCTSFNNNIDLGSIIKDSTSNYKITTIEGYFMNGCESFNKEITFLNMSIMSNIGTYFLNNCKNFNQPLTFGIQLQQIPSRFMNGCELFNSSIHFNATGVYISDYFMSDCKSLTYFDIADNIANISSSYFLYNCYSLEYITVENNNIILNGQTCLSNNSQYCAAYQNELTIAGSYSPTFAQNLPNITSSPYYRRIYWD